MWHMDSATFGNIDLGMTQTQMDQFRRARVGDVGRGLFRDYNPTGPLPVNVSWTFTGAQMQLFREAWEDVAELAWGANWFTADLPLRHPDITDRSDISVTAGVNHFFNVTIGTGPSGNRKGFADGRWNTITSHGTCKPNRVDGRWVQYCYLDTNTDVFSLRFHDGVTNVQVNGQSSVNVTFPQTGETVTATWNGTEYQVTAFSTPAPDTFTLLFGASNGDTFEVVALWGRARMQLATCHFTRPFQPTYLGPDAWKVNGQLEVDIAP